MMRSLRSPQIIVAGMLGHSPCDFTHYIPGNQDEAARVMDDILTPISNDLKSLNSKAN